MPDKPTIEDLKSEQKRLLSRVDLNTGARQALYPISKLVRESQDRLEMEERDLKERLREISAVLKHIE